MFCTNCGEHVKDGDHFCNRCGAPLQAPGGITPSPPASRSPQMPPAQNVPRRPRAAKPKNPYRDQIAE